MGQYFDMSINAMERVNGNERFVANKSSAFSLVLRAWQITSCIYQFYSLWLCIKPGLEPTIYRTRIEDANRHIRNAVYLSYA